MSQASVPMAMSLNRGVFGTEQSVSPLLSMLSGHIDRLPHHLGIENGGAPWEAWHEALYRPLEDFLGRSGKSFRANFVSLCWKLAGGHGNLPAQIPLFVELLHAGSLIVDDIEDSAQMRRGAPALHHLCGMPKALNAGNWLYFWPQTILAGMELDPEVELRIHRWIAQTLSRCHHGQALDLAIRVFEWDQLHVASMVETSTRLKSGALFELAAAIGAIHAKAQTSCEKALVRFGGDLGLALQMYDDLSGLVNDSRMDKAQEDLIQARLTWPWAWLALHVDQLEYTRLRGLARSVYERDAPFHELRDALIKSLPDDVFLHPRNLLQSAFNDVRPHVRSVAALQSLNDEIKRLESSYV
ncbi:MAG: hypothetical protein AMXMBFR84_46340 [Candidatus Hydrogenedentota bacterium]